MSRIAVFQLFPALDPAVEAALRASIERFGVIVPVVVDQDGNIIDGHHRRRIAAEVGVECPEIVRPVADKDETAELAVTLNVDRRHLDPEQRRAVAADLRAQGHSLRAIAGALGAGLATIHEDLSGVRPRTPDKTRGRDGKLYPSTRQAPPEPEQAADPLPWEPLDGEPDDFDQVCLTCGEVFPVEVWHCPGCAHHWAIGDDWCKNCNEWERNPNGDIARWEPADDDDEDPKELVTDPGPAIRKPDLGGGIAHPARFSDELLPVFTELLKGHRRVLDPFAGTGRIHELRPEFETVGIELEPEWADLSPHTQVGNALALPFADDTFDAICTSPTYGNRLADHHNAADPHLRRSYTHDLGRQLHDDNSGAMQWGLRYRAFHEDAWFEAVRVLRPGGRFVLNIKDHIRDGRWQDVAGWHIRALSDLGLEVVAIRPVVTRSLRQGENADSRVAAELVIAMDRSE